jgi:hypothetical protein
MSMSITGCGASPPQVARGGRMDVSSMVEQAFSKVDTKNQGYIDEAELGSALGQGTGTQSSNSTASDVMKALDSDGDGKLTKDEMTSGLEKLASALDQQFATMRTQGDGPHRMHGHRPPPPADANNASSSDQSASTANQDASAEVSHPKHGHHHGHADALGQIVRLVEASGGSAATQQTSTLSVTA